MKHLESGHTLAVVSARIPSVNNTYDWLAKAKLC